MGISPSLCSILFMHILKSIFEGLKSWAYTLEVLVKVNSHAYMWAYTLEVLLNVNCSWLYFRVLWCYVWNRWYVKFYVKGQVMFLLLWIVDKINICPFSLVMAIDTLGHILMHNVVFKVFLIFELWWGGVEVGP